MRTRREVLIGATVSAITANSVVAGSMPTVSDILRDLEVALHREVAGLTKVQIEFRPTDTRVPLLVHAYRI